MLFSLHLRVDYEHISLKNHRRKLEFFMQKGNTLINSAGDTEAWIQFSSHTLNGVYWWGHMFLNSKWVCLFGIPKGWLTKVFSSKQYLTCSHSGHLTTKDFCKMGSKSRAFWNCSMAFCCFPISPFLYLPVVLNLTLCPSGGTVSSWVYLCGKWTICSLECCDTL